MSAEKKKLDLRVEQLLVPIDEARRAKKPTSATASVSTQMMMLPKRDRSLK